MTTLTIGTQVEPLNGGEMAKEYDPSNGRVQMKVTKTRQAGETFWVARCKEDGDAVTASSEAEATLKFMQQHMPRHPGRQVDKV